MTDEIVLIQINRNAKAVAVVLSVEDYLNLESLKIQYLKKRVEQAKEEIASGRIVDGDVFFDDLLNLINNEPVSICIPSTTRSHMV
jgi:hypothetical protein